ncbi:MAG: T9SS type A sorting domain-containing protein [Bacteroidetes bacterium]|nr:T9SS type A sorting domain-containing protein [Bacteroidota bacterium]
MLDLTGTIFISGSFGSGPPSPIDLDPGTGVAMLAVPSNLPPPYYNIFARYDGNGNYMWAEVFGHTCYCSVAGYKSSLAKDNSGYIYYSGIFNGSAFGSSTVDFDPGSGIANLTASSSVDNTFFVKYGIPSTPLPVELITFNGKSKGSFNYLFWSTNSEVNNEYFNIEKITNGFEFKTIGRVEGNGTTSQSSNYSFEDNYPNNGVNYYRLKQFDIDGEYRVTSCIAVENTSTNYEFNIYPTNSSGIYKINIHEKGKGELKVIDINGKVLQKESLELNNESIELDVRELSTGLYIVRISVMNEIYNCKIIKN